MPASLISTSWDPIPLRGVNFQVTIRDGGACVTVTQHFQNLEAQPIEAVYSFPLPEGAAIHGLEVRIGEKVIFGQVEEKAKAFEKYDKAMQQGHGAYLIDQDRPNILTLSVGNLLPQQSVLIQIRYVQELDIHADGGRFVIPTTISPRYVPPEQERSAPASELLHINPPRVLGPLPYGLRVEVDLLATSPIRAVESPSHPIRCTLNGNQARVELIGRHVQLDQDFVLSYSLQQSHTPQVLVGKDIGSDGYVAMVNFWPQFLLNNRQPQHFLFLIDRSGSMRGESIEQAKMALLLCLKSMHPGDHFNIYGFGSRYEKLFEKIQPYTPETLATATEHVQSLEADLGGTKIYPALRDLLSQVGEVPANVVVLSDGEVGNEDEVIQLAQSYRGRARIFSFGIGRGADELLIRGIARATDGAAEFIFPGEGLEPKILQQFARMGTPYAEQVKLDWGGLELDQLTPAVLPPLFHNQRWTVYGRLKTLQPTQVRLQATLDGNQHVWELPITPEQVDPSPVVALLFARRAIRDLEEEPRRGSRQQDRQQQARTAALVSLACRYQLMSSVTSFVAIEERQEGDSTTEIKLRRVPVALTREWGNLEAAIDEDEDEEVIVVGRLEDIDLDIVDLDNADDNIEESLCFCLRDIALDCVELPPPPAIALPAHRRDAILRTLSQQEDDADDLPEDSRGTSEQFTQLVLKQQFDGSWFLDNDLLELTGYTVNQVEKMLHALGSQSNTIRTLIATLLALHTLRRYFSDRQVEWQLLADKAEAWIRQTGLMPPLTNPGDCGVAETP
ncbi:MAG: VIT domain-containing protein, partial [Thermostichales cyanobacterium HHBFW_bins_127]